MVTLPPPPPLPPELVRFALIICNCAALLRPTDDNWCCAGRPPAIIERVPIFAEFSRTVRRILQQRFIFAMIVICGVLLSYPAASWRFEDTCTCTLVPPSLLQKQSTKYGVILWTPTTSTGLLKRCSAGASAGRSATGTGTCHVCSVLVPTTRLVPTKRRSTQRAVALGFLHHAGLMLAWPLLLVTRTGRASDWLQCGISAIRIHMAREQEEGAESPCFR